MLKKLIALGAILTLLILACGAFVQLASSGVGCANWPDCYGQINLQPDDSGATHAVANFDEHPLKDKAEAVLKGLAAGLSLITLVLLPLLAFKAQQRGPALVWWLITALLIGGESYLGMRYAQIGLAPSLFSVHSLLAYVLFAWWIWGYLRLHPSSQRRPQKAGPALFALLGIILVLTQSTLGAWVDSHFAALACTDFPRCEGHWLPNADFSQAFNLSASLFSHEAQVAIHWLHRVGALLTFALLTALMLFATNEDNPKGVRRSGSVLSFLLLVEIGLGIALINHSLPMWRSVLHQVFAALLLLPLVTIYFFSRYSWGEAFAPEQQPSEPLASPEHTPVVTSVTPPATEEPASLYDRLRHQLAKTRSGLGGVFSALKFGGSDTELWQEIETRLIMADVGMETTTNIIDRLKSSLSREQLEDPAALKHALKTQLLDLLLPYQQPLLIPEETKPYVILVVGVNGAGKTTSIGKLAHRLLGQGKRLMLAAGDTFRAAAVEQLQTWGERNNVHVVAQHTGADSASVIFDAVQSAQAKNVDVLIADTAGRLHTKSNLMEELKKIKRIIGKLDPSAPHEVLLVLDAGTGQNALSQARLFNEAVNLTGIALTKLDGTAKGGIIFALANQMKLPIRFIGVGEGLDDLQDFDAHAFVDALFSDD